MATIICTVINSLITALALLQKNILEIKNWKYEETLEHKAESVLKCLKIKFGLFFISTHILCILFWYFVGCFCSVYRNTQIHLVKDTLISFGFSLLYPLTIYLLPSIF